MACRIASHSVTRLLLDRACFSPPWVGTTQRSMCFLATVLFAPHERKIASLAIEGMAAAWMRALVCDSFLHSSAAIALFVSSQQPQALLTTIEIFNFCCYEYTWKIPYFCYKLPTSTTILCWQILLRKSALRVAFFNISLIILIGWYYYRHVFHITFLQHSRTYFAVFVFFFYNSLYNLLWCYYVADIL